MKCGVKFCGGCNSRFERGNAYNNIKDQLSKEVYFEYANEDEIYDLILIIGGCTNCCASIEHLKWSKGIVKLFDKDDIDKVIRIIRDFK